MIQSKKVPELRFRGFSGAWEEKKLSDIAKVYDGTHQTPNYQKEGVPFYSVEQVTANNFDDVKFVSGEVYREELKRVIIEKGDILMTRIGDIGSTKYIDWDVRASFYVSLALIKHSDKYNSKFLNQYIKTDIFQRELWQRTIHVAFPKKINLGEISHCLVKTPAKEEQEKIAEFLGVVDDKVSGLEKKKKRLEKYKKGVMQKIFTQEIRFKNENSKNYPNWQKKKLGELLRERKTYLTKGGELEHISLTTKGVVPKSARYERDFLVNKATDKNYKITYLNDICYNPANLKFGVIARNKYGDGIFSPIYVTFEVVNQNIEFVEYLVTRKDFIQKARKYEEGTVFERMAVKPSDIIKLDTLVPCIEEQEKIADFLTAIDDKIELTKKELGQAKNWKKGLLQRMFV